MKTQRLAASFLLIAAVFVTGCKRIGLRITDDESMRIVQRGTQTITGNPRDVTISVGDVTGGAADVALEAVGEPKTFLRIPMREGEVGYFDYHGVQYRLKLDRFENHLMHDDYAFVSLRRVGKGEGSTPIGDRGNTQ